MEPQAIINSIEDWARRGMFKFSGYELSRNEAETVIRALKKEVEREQSTAKGGTVPEGK